MLEQFGLFLGGMLLLVLGADSLVKGASGLALRFGVSPLIVGMVLVGFGTSAPELVVNLTAAWQGRYELAVGNVVGSNIGNIGLILGITAIVAPLVAEMRLLRIELPLVLVVYAGLWTLGVDGELAAFDALVLLAGFAAWLVMMLRDARREPAAVQAELNQVAETQTDLGRNLLRVVLGLGLLILGARLMVSAAVFMASAWGMSELAIGLTVVAIGTSLPELASTVVAALRGQSDLALGNIVGSCLFNVLFILGATAAVHPIPVAPLLQSVDIPVMFVFAAVLIPLLWNGRRLGRGGGLALIAGFAAWLAWQLWLATAAS